MSGAESRHADLRRAVRDRRHPGEYLAEAGMQIGVWLVLGAILAWVEVGSRLTVVVVFWRLGPPQWMSARGSTDRRHGDADVEHEQWLSRLGGVMRGRHEWSHRRADRLVAEARHRLLATRRRPDEEFGSIDVYALRSARQVSTPRAWWQWAAPGTTCQEWRITPERPGRRRGGCCMTRRFPPKRGSPACSSCCTRRRPPRSGPCDSTTSS